MQNFDQPNILLDQFQRRYDTTQAPAKHFSYNCMLYDYMDAESLKCT